MRTPARASRRALILNAVPHLRTVTITFCAKAAQTRRGLSPKKAQCRVVSLFIYALRTRTGICDANVIARPYTCFSSPHFSDDVARAEARKRVQSKSALPLHREMVRLHNEFKEKGGSIKVYAGKVSIQWSEDGSIVRQVTFL